MSKLFYILLTIILTVGGVASTTAHNLIEQNKIIYSLVILPIGVSILLGIYFIFLREPKKNTNISTKGVDEK